MWKIRTVNRNIRLEDGHTSLLTNIFDRHCACVNIKIDLYKCYVAVMHLELILGLDSRAFGLDSLVDSSLKLKSGGGLGSLTALVVYVCFPRFFLQKHLSNRKSFPCLHSQI